MGSPSLGGLRASSMKRVQVQVHLLGVMCTATVVTFALEVEDTLLAVLSSLPGVGMDMGFGLASLMERIAKKSLAVVAVKVEAALLDIRPPKRLDPYDTRREMKLESSLAFAQRPLGLASAGAEENLT